MLPKCWEIANHAPEVYEAADLFIDAGDWVRASDDRRVHAQLGARRATRALGTPSSACRRRSFSSRSTRSCRACAASGSRTSSLPCRRAGAVSGKSRRA